MTLGFYFIINIIFYGSLVDLADGGYCDQSRHNPVVYICKESQAVNQSVVYIDSRYSVAQGTQGAAQCSCVVKPVVEAYRITVLSEYLQIPRELYYNVSNMNSGRLTGITRILNIDKNITIIYNGSLTINTSFCLQIRVDTVSRGIITVTCSFAEDTNPSTPDDKHNTPATPGKTDSVVIVCGVVVAILFMVGLVTGCVFAFRRKRKRNSRDTAKKSVVFDNRTYTESGLQQTDDGPVTENTNEVPENIRTTDNYDRINSCSERQSFEYCYVEQNDSAIDSTYPHDRKPEQHFGQKHQLQVSGHCKHVEFSETDTYDHMNVCGNVLPFNEYNYLRNVNKCSTDANNMYDKMSVANIGQGTAREDDSENDAYDVTKL